MLCCKKQLCLSVVNQPYATNVNQQYIIMGNDVILKCDVPSFVADFVDVVGWQDNNGATVGSLSGPTGN